MTYLKKRLEADELQEKINAYGTLNTDIKKKINYKFRLNWNYYSNSMEGNTLTMEETRSIMVGNISIHNKSIKEIMEIKGHDEVISTILKMGRGEVKLSEKRIKEIHKSIMYEEDVEKRRKAGIWKTEPNYIINYKNERFDFTAPADVPDQMHALINKTNAAIDAITAKRKNAPHPLDVALQFHLEYLRIHPFYDGNGRTARILTNLLLISFGYPPFWVKEEERRYYMQYIADIQGYGGDPDLFFEYITTMILRSQKLVLEAIQGKDISEPEDIDKKIHLLEQELSATNPDEEIKIRLNEQVFTDILNSWLGELIRESVFMIQKFNKFFIGINHITRLMGELGSLINISFIDETPNTVIEMFEKKWEDIQQKQHFNGVNFNIIIQTFYGTFIKGGLDTFGCNYKIEIKFNMIKYEVWVDVFSEEKTIPEKFFERLLHKPLTENDRKKIVTQLGESIYSHIDYYTKKNGIR